MGELTDKIQGKAKQVKGKVTGDRSEQVKGKLQEVKGNVKGAINDLKDGHDDSDDWTEPTVTAETMSGGTTVNRHTV